MQDIVYARKMWVVSYSPRGPGHVISFQAAFDHDPSPHEIITEFGFSPGSPHYERIVDGSFTVENRNLSGDSVKSTARPFRPAVQT